ncbi:hypothetical protein DFH09DRAFT_1363637 [Mycena vulgaris]|nr:hypothetical protein DFH09DRAFT_1363637 [Mycena vulgaris]
MSILAPDACEVQAALNTLDLFTNASTTAGAELERLTRELNAAKENALARAKERDGFREQLKIALVRVETEKSARLAAETQLSGERARFEAREEVRAKMSKALATDLRQAAQKLQETDED